MSLPQSCQVITVVLCHVPINDLKPLQSIPNLTLSLEIIKSIQDYSFFVNIQNLTITASSSSGFPMTIFNFLTHLQSIRLADCDIEHVNGLNNIPKVFLNGCNKLKDVNGLGNNHSVDIRYCVKLKRVDNLATVPIVTIIGCRSIEDYSCLKNVPRLKSYFE
eukprot:gene3220-3432_t